MFLYVIPIFISSIFLSKTSNICKLHTMCFAVFYTKMDDFDPFFRDAVSIK